MTRSPGGRPLLRRLFVVSFVLATVGCAAGPRLTVSPSQAEFPFAPTPVRVDGRVESSEWAAARSVNVDLADGRRIRVLMQRDRTRFEFAVVGLDGPAIRRVEPQVLFDLWGNRTSTWDDNDWWVSVGQRICFDRGGWDDGDCGRVVPGFEANLFPLERGQAVEIAAEFDAMGFDENYENPIGLAFRFVDDTGRQVGIWPLRAEVEDPSTWAPISLRH